MATYSIEANLIRHSVVASDRVRRVSNLLSFLDVLRTRVAMTYDNMGRNTHGIMEGQRLRVGLGGRGWGGRHRPVHVNR